MTQKSNTTTLLRAHHLGAEEGTDAVLEKHKIDTLVVPA